jgi:TM2 domain-containing membrane protein YozV
MLAIILSIILPGLGQIYYGKVFKGLLMIFLTFVPFIYPIVLIWSIYDCIQLRKKVTVDPITRKQAILALITGFIIIPLIATALFSGAFYVASKISNQYLKKYNTVSEMKKIQVELEKNFNKEGTYPENLSVIIGSSPVNQTLYTDSWGNLYNYEKTNDNEFKLTSNGVDGLPNTKDDIIVP